VAQNLGGVRGPKVNPCTDGGLSSAQSLFKSIRFDQDELSLLVLLRTFAPNAADKTPPAGRGATVKPWKVRAKAFMGMRGSGATHTDTVTPRDLHVIDTAPGSENGYVTPR